MKELTKTDNIFIVAVVRSLFAVLSVLAPFYSWAQVVNAYAEVTNISGTTITISSVDESGDSFEDGEQVIIMQMQDDVIGSNMSNNINFGNLSSIASAGLFETAAINSHSESSGIPTTITLSDPLTNTFNIGSNSSVQIISYPTLGSPDYTTTSDMSAKSWDGKTGGVLAFNVSGTLTIAHNLDVEGDGFRGANSNGGPSVGCSGGSNYRLSTNDYHADKGEGIYLSTNTLYQAGRAKILNGGGGGNSHNGGGGGGGNFEAGGTGGPGWPNCSPSAGGIGGIGLSSYISASRVFMGGGGGAGEGNNGGSQDAGDGGGIILIHANEVVTSGSCGGIIVSANGSSVLTGSGNDGNSGGGAGGSIIFDVTTWNIPAGCHLTVQANGGDGGDVTHGDIHGAGGGGGMGTIIFSINEPTVNTTVNTVSGDGGSNCTSCGRASNGGGAAGDGIIDELSGPLPIELQSFEGYYFSNFNSIVLEWETLSEINNDYFTIEKSKDGKVWEEITRIRGNGTTSRKNSYSYGDSNPFEGYNYYRLSQTDFDGTRESFEPIAVKGKENDEQLTIYPNPSPGCIYADYKGSYDKNINFQIRNIDGVLIKSKLAFPNEISHLELISGLEKGLYFVSVHKEGQETQVIKFIVH